MTSKQIALLNVAKMVVFAMITGALAGYLLITFSLAHISMALSAAILLYVIKMMYDLELDKAERLKQLNESNS
jgi:uncharacterized membrane protein YfcA